MRAQTQSVLHLPPSTPPVPTPPPRAHAAGCPSPTRAGRWWRALYNQSTLSSTTRAIAKIDELADRVERLLLRHDELLRTKALLEGQLASVSHERDSLRSRLNAARSRIDALLERLPTEAAAVPSSADVDIPTGP